MTGSGAVSIRLFTLFVSLTALVCIWKFVLPLSEVNEAGAIDRFPNSWMKFVNGGLETLSSISQSAVLLISSSAVDPSTSHGSYSKADEAEPRGDRKYISGGGRNILWLETEDMAKERIISEWQTLQNMRDLQDTKSLPKQEYSSRQGPNRYSLGPKINDWDAQRARYVAKHPGCNVGKDGEERMLLITGSQPKMCANNVGDRFLLKSIKNKLDYCNPRGIEIFYNLASLDSSMTGFWSKLPLIRQLMLSHPHVEWFWWMDSDAIFTDMSFNLPMDKYRNYNLVLHGWDDLVYNKKDWVGLNTGSFLMRNNQWMLDLLDEWSVFGPKGKVRDEAGKLFTSKLKGRPDFEADDQSALVWLLIDQKDVWAPKTYLESSYYLHGYWGILVNKYEEMMSKYHPGLGDDRWPFVTHFVGCKPCGNPKELNLEEFNKCFHHMERAYNFADNQVLNVFGFEHVHLSTPIVQPVNLTSRPKE